MALGRALRGPLQGQPFSMIETSATTYSPTREQHGVIFHATATSGTQTFTLPAAGAQDGGLMFGFLCGHADGEILINPNSSSYSIKLVTHTSVGTDVDTAVVAPAAGTGVKNTAATNAVTDILILFYAPTGAIWYSLGIATGIWASQ